jgi:putative FmdB family regulatory protein
MPCYSYKCESCGEIYEEIRKIDSYKDPFYCSCNGQEKECRLILSSDQVIRKGGGLYSLDFGKPPILRDED